METMKEINLYGIFSARVEEIYRAMRGGVIMRPKTLCICKDAEGNMTVREETAARAERETDGLVSIVPVTTITPDDAEHFSLKATLFAAAVDFAAALREGGEE